jgi:hypothetical protein
MNFVVATFPRHRAPIQYTFGMSQGYDSVKPLDLSLATLFFGYLIVLYTNLPHPANLRNEILHWV